MLGILLVLVVDDNGWLCFQWVEGMEGHLAVVVKRLPVGMEVRVGWSGTVGCLETQGAAFSVGLVKLVGSEKERLAVAVLL
jgi:hypothetical protein